MRIAFITLYQYDYGARCLMGYLEKFGHQTLLVRVKRNRPRPVPWNESEKLQAIIDGGDIPMMEVFPDHVLVCPYPHPLSDEEVGLIVGQVESFHPDFLAFSLTSSHIRLATEISRRLRARLPGVRQIWGGIHPTFRPAECLEWADAVCVGEGEEALLDYVNAPARTDIPNIHVKGADGQIICNPPRPLIKDLDTLPMPVYLGHEVLVDQGRIWRLEDIPPIETAADVVICSSRGCPYNCSYCLSGAVRDMYRGQRYRRRKSVDVFLAEVQTRARTMKLEQGFAIWDDVFTMDEDWIAEFAEKYPKLIGLPFGGFCHPRTATRRILEDLKRAGCIFLVMGIQSGSPYIAEDIYNRTLKEEEFLRFSRLLQETGHNRLIYDLITRCPYEREEDLIQTVRLLAKLPKPIKIGLKILAIYPHARIKDLDRPKYNVDDRTYQFYESLYMLAALPGFDPPMLTALLEDPYLREHPELVRAWASGLNNLKETGDALERDKANLEREVSIARQARRAVEAEMPWGVRRAAKHLAAQICSALRRGASRARHR